MPNLDALIIGGGAAGIAAARVLHDAGLDTLLIEAKSRLGGRAHTVVLDGHPLDAGCGWLHSARRNPWTTLAGHYGLTVDRSPTSWRTQWRDLGFSALEQEAFGKAWGRMEQAAQAALAGPDRPLAKFVRDERWRPLLDAISGYANGAPLRDVSLHDWAAYEDAATGDNWTVREGYGTLITRHAQGLPVELDTRATLIHHGGARLRVETDRGTIDAARVIVALPTPALAREAVCFDPSLPDKHAAAADLPLGLADKIFLRVEGPALPRNGHLIGNPYDASTASYRLSPFGWPVVEAFVGGDAAEALEREDDRAAFAFATGELTGLLGSDWRFAPLACTRWRGDADIGGSYSHARIGAAGQRAVLAAPVDDRLFFAGDACSGHDFSTAHGAYQTGVDAAQAVLASLGRSGTTAR